MVETSISSKAKENFLISGMILLDCKAKTFLNVCDRVANAMISEGITCRRRDIMQILAMKHA